MPSRYYSVLATVLLMTQLFLITGSARSEVKEYRVGVVPQFEQRKLYRIWRPILDRLEKHTNLKLTLVGTSKIPEFEKHLYAGKFDIAYMNPFHLLKSHQTQGYLPVINDGSRKLKGILVVRKSSVFTTPGQLDRKIVAFPSPNALGASLLLRAELEKEFNVRIKPKYVRTHSSVYLHVAKDLVPAGGGVRRTLEAQEENIRNELRVIHETQGISPHPIAIHPRVPQNDQQKIISALIQMGNNETDNRLLANIPIVKIHKTSLTDYKSLSELGLNRYYVDQ